jgi:5-oxoprolinase (ATP-hydrolysing)
VRLEIFNNHFSTIARQMGISLQMTSMSVNVKERLDFSCAIFTRTGDLVVNAPHIPVHLGAMSETVRAIIRLNQNPGRGENVNPGDVFVTNDPFAGGSHLPDVTVITPIFDASNRELIFWVASRSHHSEIGGISPGSMPAGATNLAEEGVLIRNFKLIDGHANVERFDELRTLLLSPPYPSRSPNENLADIRAQVAANRSGQRDLLALVDQYSQETVSAYMGYIQSAAEQKVRAAIAKMDDGIYSFKDSMDNGATIRVRIEIDDDELKIDFSGTDPVLKSNLNANPAIVASAVIYVMRCLIDEDIPLNEGVMKPVSIKLPECFLNPASFDDPAKCPAVVGGNVETSQRVVDVLLGAMQKSVPGRGLAAASQGTMNNWLMGDESFGYYETLGGGSGATFELNGTDAVHTHMTNTRLTDPEIIETRYPVVLRELAIRTGSGGAGCHAGGEGMVREIEFLKPLTVSLLTNRRTTQPYGIMGGKSGSPGRNLLIQNQGSQQPLASSCEIEVQSGDRLRIETPGGGGWGSPDQANQDPAGGNLAMHTNRSGVTGVRIKGRDSHIECRKPSIN